MLQFNRMADDSTMMLVVNSKGSIVYSSKTLAQRLNLPAARLQAGGSSARSLDAILPAPIQRLHSQVRGSAHIMCS
jgi:hypothetical protein